MEALLIPAGAVLLAAGWIWLVAVTMRRSVTRMVLALLFGPLTLLMRGMGYPMPPRLLMLTGVLALVSGSFWLQHQHPDRADQLIAGDWLVEPAAGGALRGTIMGQPFNPDSITWRGDDLLLEESPDGRTRRSLTIRFGNARELLLQPSVERLPDDDGAWPELILRWHTGALAEPGLRRVTGDYSLSLDLTRVGDDQVEGRIHLHLPTSYSTWLTGAFRLTTAPDWMSEREQTERLVLQAVPSVAPENPRPMPASPAWRELSLLALLDEPDLFSGAQIRLTTWTGRVHQGVFRQLSPEQRIVLSLPRGANQVELHFHPLDIRLIEEAVRR